MPYIGNTSPSRFVSNRAASVYSGDGSTTAFTLEQAVAQDEDVLVSVDGVIQEPSVAYAVSNGTTLTFTGAPSSDSGNNIFVYYLASQVGTAGPPNDSVSTTTLKNSAVTNAKVANSTLDLTSKVTGVLPVANGGTGLSSGLGLIIKRTVITGATGTVSSTSSYQTIKTYSFTPQANTVSMLVYFKTTASHRAGAFSWHRLKYDGDILAVQQAYDSGTNVQFTSSDQDVFISTITLPKSGTLNFTYEGANNSSPAVGIGNNSTLTIVELGL